MEDACTILKRSPYFRGLPDAPLYVIAARSRNVTVPKGTVLGEEGTPATAAWVLGRGFVETRKTLPKGGQETLATNHPGTLFGHIALLDGQTRSASLVATATCDLVEFSRADFDWLHREPGVPGRFFRRAMILALGDTLLASATHLKEITQKGIESTPPDDPETYLKRLLSKLYGGR